MGRAARGNRDKIARKVGLCLILGQHRLPDAAAQIGIKVIERPYPFPSKWKTTPFCHRVGPCERCGSRVVAWWNPDLCWEDIPVEFHEVE